MKVPLSPSPPELDELEDPELEGEAPELVLLAPDEKEAFSAAPDADIAVFAVATGTCPDAVTVTVAVEPADVGLAVAESPFLDL